MIEVEKKIAIDDEDVLRRLIDGAEFIKEVVNHDVYFDDEAFSLTIAERWLRKRNNAWELKIAIHKKNRLADQYHELEVEKEIKEALSLDQDGSLDDVVAQAGYKPFGTIITTRRKYRFESFTIDIDATDFGESTYSVGEIEILVQDTSQIKEALQNIDTFLKKHGLGKTSPRGKLIEYLFRHRPKHYQALRNAGVAGA